MVGEKRKRDSTADPVDSSLIDEFGDRLLLVSQTPNSSNLDNLATFTGKSSLQILQAWSYYSQTNNHAKLISATGKIGQFLSICNENLQILSKNGVLIIKEILEHHLKIVYRCLFSSRTGMTNPALRILREISSYNNGSFTGDLFSSLDLSLKAFPKILASGSDEDLTKNSMRSSFILFYLSFIKNGSPIIRKDLILQKKIVAGWFKRLNQDTDELIISMLNVLRESILLESAFTKSTKISFFNDWVLNNLVKLFTRSDKVVGELVKFLTLLSTDSINGIKFPDNGWYPSTRVKQITEGDATTNSIEDSIYNRLLLSLLKVLKPWEDSAQQDLSISILKSSPELVAPYLTIGLESISFNPRLSSFWISYTNFLSRIIQLPIPHLQVLQPPPTSTVVESILPIAISKASLTKCLSFETPLIRYLACQLIIFSLRKTLMVTQEYSKRGWDSSDITFIINERLPLLQTIVSSLNLRSEDAPTTPTSLLNTVVTIALSLYSSVFPEHISSFPLPSTLTTNWQQTIDENTDALKLIQIRESLQLQMSSTSLGKWYNKSDSTYSIFTRLVQLSVSNNSFSDQVIQLLKSLTNPTLLFQDESLVSPVEILIKTLTNSIEQMSSDDKDKTWKLIDESIARCMRSPYKYVDEFALIRENDSDIISPFIVTLLEQWKFVPQPNEFVQKWLYRFIRDCCICGESWNTSYSLVKEKVGESDLSDLLVEKRFLNWKEVLELDEFFDFVLSTDSSNIIDRNDLQFKILGDYELQAVKFRLVHDSKNKKLVNHLFSSIPLFLANSFSSKVFFKDLLSTSGVVNGYFTTLHSFIKEDPTIDTTDIKSYVADKFTSNLDKLTSSIWLLDSSDILSILKTNKFSSSFFKLCIDRLTELKEPLDISILKTLMNNNEVIDSDIAKSLAGNFEINPPKLNDDLDDILEILFNNNYIKVMCSIIRSTHHLPEFLQTVDISNDSLIEIASTVAETNTDNDNTIYNTLFVKASNYALNSLTTNDIDIVTPSLELLSRTLNILSPEQLTKVTTFFNNVSGTISLSSAIVNLSGSFYKHNPDGLKTWLQKCIIWLTKRFSEDSNISTGLKGFLTSFDTAICKNNINIWSLVPKRLLNSLIESTTSKWLHQPEVVKLTCSIIFLGDSKSIEYKKHLQVIINQPIESITDILSLLIWKLYTIDEKSQSNQHLQDRILSIYLGSNSPKDTLLLDILKRIESSLGVTWTNRVFSWDFQSSNNLVDNYDRTPTFTNTKNGFEVSLDIELIKSSVQNFNPLANFSLKNNLTLDECLQEMNRFTSLYHTSDVYNSELLLLSLASSLEIFKENGAIDLKVFVESYGLSFVLCCLSSEVPTTLLKSSKNIIGAIIYFLSEESELPCTYREKTIIKLLSSKIANYFSSNNEQNEKYLPSCVCVMMGLILPILTNPGHFLNEKAIDFLLSGPSLRPTELPLFQSITQTTSENATKEMQWLIESLTFSLSTQKDIAVYMQKGVFEYFLSLRDLSPAIKIERLILKAQETAGGSMSLITRNGALSWVSNELSKSQPDSGKELSVRKLATRFIVTSDENRLKDWTDDSIQEFMIGMKM